ncbi:Peptidyl-Lys metalloendopeptidase [Mycena venus]|uniref:Peptidyl-Lys metalloendopeptidase n=1 Tax=Mycena venus TaxID=2733690 RepID=A0A8H6YCR6_9AGAR|nr:Peptidyl-Lys metalloendopeptidase [Mycena venus]
MPGLSACARTQPVYFSSSRITFDPGLAEILLVALERRGLLPASFDFRTAPQLILRSLVHGDDNEHCMWRQPYLCSEAYVQPGIKTEVSPPSVLSTNSRFSAQYVLLLGPLRSGCIGLCGSSVCCPRAFLVAHRHVSACCLYLCLNISIGPSEVSSVSALHVTATLVNTGDVELKLLNDPRTVLHTFETDTFAITDPSGNTPSFKGLVAKYVPAKVVERNLESSFTVLAPGASISVTHDLSKAYNFTASGESTYDIAASNKFQYVDAETNELVTIHADHADTHTAAVSGELAVSRRSSLGKRIAYQSCSSSEKTTLVSAASAAQTYANNAKSYLTTQTTTSTRFVTWFGTFTTAHHTTILSHYTKMAAATYSSYTFDCSCTDTDTYAYVFPDEFGTIYLCGVFWDAPLTGTDSQGGTLIHESSHFDNLAQTQDYVYGQTAAKSLAKSNSAEAIENADNHEYFAENNPAQS